MRQSIHNLKIGGLYQNYITSDRIHHSPLEKVLNFQKIIAFKKNNRPHTSNIYVESSLHYDQQQSFNPELSNSHNNSEAKSNFLKNNLFKPINISKSFCMVMKEKQNKQKSYDQARIKYSTVDVHQMKTHAYNNNYKEKMAKYRSNKEKSFVKIKMENNSKNKNTIIDFLRLQKEEKKKEKLSKNDIFDTSDKYIENKYSFQSQRIHMNKKDEARERRVLSNARRNQSLHKKCLIKKIFENVMPPANEKDQSQRVDPWFIVETQY